jgi:hypothetical protein
LKSPDSDKRMIRKLSNSPYLLSVADSILKNIDRETLAELLASYLYLRSNGRANIGNLVAYAVSRRFWECASIAASATPAVLAGIISDKEFRSVVLTSLGSLMTGRPPREGTAGQE